MPATESSVGHPSWVGRINAEGRILLRPRGSHWTARLVYRFPDGRRNIFLGTYPTLDEAKQQTEQQAREICKGAGRELAPTPIDWVQVAPLRSNGRGGTTPTFTTVVRRITPLFVSVIGVAASLVAFLAQLPKSSLLSQSAVTEEAVAQIRADLNATNRKLDALSKAMSATPPPKSQAPAADPRAIADLRSDLSSVRQHLSAYEAALGDDPSRRVALPMLRKDLDSMRDQHKQDLLAIHDEMNRTFDLMKWLLGFLGVGTFLGGVSGFFNRSRRSE